MNYDNGYEDGLKTGKQKADKALREENERLRRIEGAARAVFMDPLDLDAMLALGAALADQPTEETS